MKRNHTYSVLSALLALFAVMACGLPSLAAQPAPVTGPNAINTAIAGTSRAAVQETEQAQLNSTSTLAPTATPTSTPKISNSGTSLVSLADNSTQFIDHVAGIQMVFPEGWMVIRVGEQEYYEAWGKPEAQNPKFLDIFAGMQNLDPKIFRMTALDIRPDRFIYNDITQVDVVFDQGDTRTLKQLRTNEIQNHLPLKKYKLLSSQYFTTSQGIEALNMEIKWQTSNGASQTGMGYRRRIVFKVPAGSMAVDLTILLDKKDLTMPDFDQLINNIVLITP